jgi:hypothetical protein
VAGGLYPSPYGDGHATSRIVAACAALAGRLKP